MPGLIFSVVASLARWLERHARAALHRLRRTEVVIEPRAAREPETWTLAFAYPLADEVLDDIQELGPLRELGGVSKLRARLLKHGGVDCGERDDRLVVRSTVGRVVIEEIDVEIVGRRPFPAGATVHAPQGGANDETLVGFDLSANSPWCQKVVRFGGLTWTGEPGFVGTWEIGGGTDALMPLSVVSRAPVDEAVAWRLFVTYRLGGSRRVARYPRRGSPLVTYGSAAHERALQRWVGGIGSMGAAITRINADGTLRDGAL